MTENILPYEPFGYPSPSPGETGIGRWLSWIVIIACVAYVSGMNWIESRKSAGAPAATPVRVDPATELTGRYLLGAHALAIRTGQGQAFTSPLMGQVDESAKTPIAKLAAVTIAAEWLGKQSALDRLDQLEPSLGATLKPAATALRVVYTRGPQDLTPEQRAQLRERLGWHAKLAQAFGKPADDPQRAAIVSSAMRTCIVLVTIAIAVPVGFIVGLILLLVLMIRLNDRELLRHYQPIRAGSGVFLEAFAIYLAGFIAASLAAAHLPQLLSKSLAAHLSLMALPTFLAIIWPMIRGVPGGTWQLAMGWHRGRGVFREIGLGLVGYLAGLPILAMGFAITFVLIRSSGANPTHPIEKMLGGPIEMKLLVIFLASIYAPVTEETMFRGAFFHALRSRHGWFLSAIVTSFIFAAIHPQGWTVVPALMAIAIVFAAIREWRGTILSSATAHCFHNSVLVAIAIQLLT